MDKFGKKIIDFTLDHSRAVIAVSLIITLAALYFIPKIKLDNSVDAFFDKKSKSYIDFQAWKEQFGSDNLIVVAFKDTDIFTAANLTLVGHLTQKFVKLTGVDTVTSLSNVNDIVGSEGDFTVGPLIENIPQDKEGLAALKQRALSNPLYIKNVISPDATTTAIAIELEHRVSGDDTYRKEVITNIKKILKTDFPRNKKYFISGSAAIEHYYTRYMQDDLQTFLPIILLVVLVVLVISFRGLTGVLLPLLVVVLSLIWTMAFLYLCGYSINNVTTVIPPIMISITLLEAIHFVWELIQKKGVKRLTTEENRALIAETMRHLFIPCFLTNITTVIGFFSLLVTRVPPIQQLGWVAGVGVFFAFIITFTTLPAAIKEFGLLRYLSTTQIESTLKNRLDSVLLSLTDFSDRHKVSILAVSAIAMALALWQTTRIKTETSIIEHFKKKSPIYQSTQFIENNLTGIHLLNVSLRSPESEYFKNPHALREIEKLQAFLDSTPGVDKTTSVVDYIKEMNRSFHNEDVGFYAIPESRNLISQYLLLYGGRDLDDYTNAGWDWNTVRIRLKEHSTVKLKKVITTINEYVQKNFGSKMTAGVVGHTVLEVNANEAVTSGQIQSLSLAMLVIFGMMFIDFRSWKLGFISMAPNVFPLLLNFGLMGLLSIRLDSVTSMISDIGLGIIVDDTIHFYHSFGEAVKETGGDYREALHKSFVIKGSPTIITSLILILGFGVTAFSKFMPTFYFGILSAVLIFNGLWSELLLSPALLMLVKPKFPREGKVKKQ